MGAVGHARATARRAPAGWRVSPARPMARVQPPNSLMDGQPAATTAPDGLRRGRRRAAAWRAGRARAAPRPPDAHLASQPLPQPGSRQREQAIAVSTHHGAKSHREASERHAAAGGERRRHETHDPTHRGSRAASHRTRPSLPSEAVQTSASTAPGRQLGTRPHGAQAARGPAGTMRCGRGAAGTAAGAGTRTDAAAIAALRPQRNA